jgi:hypothetical protein
MNDDTELETLLRGLRPGKLPADLRAAMKHPPGRDPLPWWRHPAILTVPLAAALAIAFFLPKNSATRPSGPAAVTLRQTQSTLLQSRSLEITKIEGRLWELAEQEWLDEDIALCSAAPVKVKFTEIRHELVWQPVRFD